MRRWTVGLVVLGLLLAGVGLTAVRTQAHGEEGPGPAALQDETLRSLYAELDGVLEKIADRYVELGTLTRDQAAGWISHVKAGLQMMAGSGGGCHGSGGPGMMGGMAGPGGMGGTHWF